MLFSYPEVLASDWIRIGAEVPALRDEMYCQMMKQLEQGKPVEKQNENQNPSSSFVDKEAFVAPESIRRT